MENGCELELRLSLGRSSSCGSTETPPSTEVEVSSVFERSSRYKPQEQRKQIMMFYNDQNCVCDVTEIQARAIISMARREMDDAATKINLQRNIYSSPPQKPQPQMAATAAPPQVLNPGLSMKKSLQRFLQKRKTRLNAAAAPYTHKKPLSLFTIKS